MRFSLIILLLALGHCVSAQFNIAVGYSLGYTPAEQINGLVSKFNDSFNGQTTLSKEMPDLHYMHGMNLGLRWKYERVSFEVSWERMNRTREAIGENSQDMLKEKTIYYSINNYSAGLESNFGNFGLGFALGIRNFEIKEEIANTGEREAFLDAQQYFVKPYISINLAGSDKIGLTIRPYLQIPLSSLDLNPLASELEVLGTGNKEPFWMGGVMFIFYNGAQ